MAIFEEKSKDKSKYLVLLDDKGEVAAYIKPVKTVSHELLHKAFTVKDVKTEIRESADEVLELTL